MDENWLPALREVYQALDKEALGPMVIGGRALLLLRPPPSAILSEGNLAERLSAVARVTHDLDVALIGSRNQLRVAHDLLTRHLGFRWDGMKQHRYTRGDGATEVVVDLVTAQRPPDRDEEWLIHWVLPIVAELPSVEVDGLRVMHPGGLVVLKAIASQDNQHRQRRDYIDLAQLALRDRDGVARLALTSLVPKLRRSSQARVAIRALRSVRTAFANEDTNGTVTATRELVAGALRLAVGEEESAARLLVSAAMRRLLEGVPE
jgi:hypothetical protein